MCEPVTIAAGVSAAAGLATSVMQTQAQNEQSAQNARSAKDAYILKTAALNSRIRQEGISAQQKQEDARLKAKRSQGTAKAAAASGGVKGQSVDRLLNDFSRSEAVFKDRVNEQLDATTASIRFDQQGLQSQANQRIAAVPPAGMGNLFGAAVKAGAQGFSAFKDYQAEQKGENP